MVNEAENTPQPEPEPTERTLLTEYQVCHDDASSNGSTYWTMAAIFFGINAAFLGGLLFAILSNDTLLPAFMRAAALYPFHSAPVDPHAIWLVRILVSTIGGTALTMLLILRRWQKRVNFLMNIDYTRMRQIERKLGMWLSRTVNGADHWSGLQEHEKEELRQSPFWTAFDDEWWIRKPFKREHPSSRFHAPAMFITLAALWFGLINTVWAGVWLLPLHRLLPFLY